MHAKTHIRAVSPAIATNWLEKKNKNNRNILDAIVDKYARDMANGRWVFTGDPIQFDKEGNLLNGQHRLSAVVKAGKVVQFVIWEGIDASAQDAMDAGRTRNTGQQLHMKGYKHGTTMAAVVRVLLKWDQSRLNSKDVPSTGEVVEFTNANLALVEMATHWADSIARTVSLSRGAVGAFAFRALKLAQEHPDFTSQETVIDFLEKLKTGAGLEPGDPILTLRNTSARYRVQKMRRSVARDLYNIIRVWNAVQAGEVLTTLRAPKDGVVTPENLILMHSVEGIHSE